MARTAILGWGSLIYDLRCLSQHVRGTWRSGGPELPIEFSRISGSRSGALTLVIDEANGDTVPTQFIESSRTNPDDAACDLRDREGTVIRRIGLIRKSVPAAPRSDEAAGIIWDWLAKHDFDAVIWTNLRSNFQDETTDPFSIPRAIKYLGGLLPSALAEARQYIDRAPAEVTTKLRRALSEDDWWKSLQ